MSLIAKQSTAKIVTVGPVLDADGVAVTDGVVGDFKISKNGAAPAALNGSATLTHRHTGFYSLSLTTSDTDTVGTAEVTIDDTVNSCPIKELQVVEEDIAAGLYESGATLITEANINEQCDTAISDVGLTTTITGRIDENVSAVKSDTASVLADTGTDGVLIAASHNLYTADIHFTVDELNTQDEYTVTWFKNGARITSGVTSPTIQVVARSNGADLIAATAMTEIGSTESFKKDEGTARTTGGEAYLVIAAGTIDAGARSFSRLISRDSAAA
jgi:hypothetical protein